MMNNYHGIIFAYKSYPELRELVAERTAASLPICSRYRLIDFALSSLRNAGIVDVGVIMQRDYQSLLDHLGAGKPWDMSRRSGGLRMLPPFGLPAFHQGDYAGTIEALNAVASYIEESPKKYFVLMIGNLCANINLREVCRVHEESDAEITAVCANYEPDVLHNRYVVGDDGYVMQCLYDRSGPSQGIPSLECYIINKDTLLRLMDRCRALDKYRWHQDAIAMFLREGGKMNTYIHRTYARVVRTKLAKGVSTYYGTEASSVNSLVADDCIIEGSLENCIIFRGVHVEKGAVLKNCIIMKSGIVKEGSHLSYVISDKSVIFSPETTLTGSPKLPIVVPKGTEV